MVPPFLLPASPRNQTVFNRKSQITNSKSQMNYPAASSGVSKTTTGKTLRPKGRGIHPDGINSSQRYLKFPLTLPLSPQGRGGGGEGANEFV